MLDLLAIKTIDALDRRNFSLTRSYFTADAVVSGGLLPDCTPISAALKVMNALFAAIPNFWFEIQDIAVWRNEVTVEFDWGGRHERPLKLGMLGLPIIQPTNKTIRVNQVAVFTGYHDKLCAVQMTSRTAHNLPALFAQLNTSAYANVG
ncbi:MAG: nuclear transport factor 2 family protein [Anaerolineae bacterium]|nr:nuclear transport factor 2 family protein [Anaerolineae bacterium]